jgi:probable phosphoglycerate mutase
MSEELPIMYLARHGETAWSLTGQHTGLTDLPLTERGGRTRPQLVERLRNATWFGSGGGSSNNVRLIINYPLSIL